MGHDQRQDAVLVDLAQLIAVHLAQLVLVDHPEAAIDEGLGRALGLDRDLAVDQEVQRFELLDEGVGALGGDLELLAEFEDAGERLGGLVAVEQRLAVVRFADQAAVGIEAERQLLACSGRCRARM